MLSLYPRLVAAGNKVVLRSRVTKNTQNLEYRYADFSNLQELSKTIKDKKFGTYDKGICKKQECVWDFNWQTPNLEGGIFEIIFQARKAENIHRMSIGVRIDGTVPQKAEITSIINTETQTELLLDNEKYFTNSLNLNISGIGEALTFVKVETEKNQEYECNVNSIGRWGCDIKIASLSDSQLINVLAYDKVGNVSAEKSSVSVIYDNDVPSLENIILNKKYLKSGDNLAVEIFSDEKISTADIIREDKVLFNLLNLSTLKHFGTFIPIESSATEGPYEFEINLTDLAGNKTKKNISVTIDNTPPSMAQIDTRHWGKYNGVKARKEYPSKGRLVPSFVMRGKQINLNGISEENTYVEIYINSKIKQKEFLDEKTCKSDSNLFYTQGLKNCSWNYNVALSSQKANVIQVKSCDRAGNCSDLSDEQIIYLDNKKPRIIKLLQSNDYWRSGGLFYTNKDLINLFAIGERKSDIKLEAFRLDNKVINKISRFSNLGESKKEVKLSKDGKYIFSFTSYDASGNNSKPKRLKIIKDTMAPKKPKVLKPYICKDKICSNITGEIGSQIYINGKLSGIIESKNKKIILKNNWEYNQDLIFKIYLVDKAKNKSATAFIKYKTPVAVGGAMLGEELIFGKTNQEKSLEPITGIVRIYPDKEVETDLEITPPYILGTNTNLDGSVDFWGTHTIKGKFRVEFYKKHQEDKLADLKEAFHQCRWYKYVPGISLFYTPKCVRDNYKQIQNSYEIERVEENMVFDPENLNIILYEDNKRISTQIDLDLELGRWKKQFGKGVLLPGRKVTAKLQVWGSKMIGGHEFRYNSLSKKSNSVVIKKLPEFTRLAVNPLSDKSCNGYKITSLYGRRVHPINGSISFHSGIDIAKYGGCDIVAAYKGDAETTWYAGKTVKVKHNQELETRYGHASNYFGGYPRYVNTAEEIMRMGCSGLCTGTHIHFEVWENGKHKNPTNYFNF